MFLASQVPTQVEVPTLSILENGPVGVFVPLSSTNSKVTVVGGEVNEEKSHVT